MARLDWGETGKRFYETGVSNGVLYLMNAAGAYQKGEAWDGLISITESPSGAEETKLYANNSKYLSLISAEEYGATIEAYIYPDSFSLCDGSAELAPGVRVGQQERKTFGLCYRTILGNDTEKTEHGYKLHIVYGCTAKPSQKAFKSINENTEAVTFSWELTTTPVSVGGMKPTATIEIDSTKVDPTKLKALEDILYGSADKEAKLPLPDEVAQLLTVTPGA